MRGSGRAHEWLTSSGLNVLSRMIIVALLLSFQIDEHDLVCEFVKTLELGEQTRVLSDDTQLLVPP